LARPLPSTASSDDVALVRRAQSGDADAYSQLVRAHQGMARRVATLVAGPNDADEVAQLAFIKAFRALGRFQVGRPFGPWLLQIVVNEGRTVRRAEVRQAALLGRAAAEFGRSHGEVEPDVRVARSETRVAIGVALSRLPEKHRDVVACRYLLELSEEETSRMLGVRPGTVKSRLSRALARLRYEFEGVHRAREEHGRVAPAPAGISADPAV
jgi:RNA polymerase sigma factor (sigma-70 family)